MPLLEVKNLHTYFKTKKGIVKAVNDVSYSLEPGKTIGIVGESGSGKSVSAMSILQLLDANGYIAGGEVLFEGKDLTKLSLNEMYQIRGNAISVIFQEPMTSLNPVFTIGQQLAEVLEQHEGLNSYTNGAVSESVRSIVGVQFRNLATVGGSIFGRFGFSDVLTCFLALDTWVELYKGGCIPLAEFARQKPDRDILVRLIVKKHEDKSVYLSHRNSKTDFPVLTCGISLRDGQIYTAVGARPSRAVCLWVSEADWKKKGSEALAGELAAQFPTEGNMRAGKEFRSHLAEVLIGRGLKQIEKMQEV